MYHVVVRFSLGNDLNNNYSSLSFVRLCMPISSVLIGGIRQFVVQIPSMGAILMESLVAVHVRTIMHRSKFSMGNMILRRVLIIPVPLE